MYTPAHVLAQARRRALARSRERARRAAARTARDAEGDARAQPAVLRPARRLRPARAALQALPPRRARPGAVVAARRGARPRAPRPGARRQAGAGVPRRLSMKVVLRNPRREVEVAGNRRVKDVLRELDILPETVLVIRGDDLVTADQMLRDDDVIDLRPVMSGGVR